MNNLHDTNENENEYWWQVAFYDFTKNTTGTAYLFPERAKAVAYADSIRTDKVMAFIDPVVVV